MTLKIQVNRTILWWSIIFIALLRPAGAVRVLGISSISAIINMLAVVISVLYTVKYMKFSKTTLYYILYLCWIVFVTSVQNIGGGQTFQSVFWHLLEI